MLTFQIFIYFFFQFSYFDSTLGIKSAFSVLIRVFLVRFETLIEVCVVLVMGISYKFIFLELFLTPWEGLKKFGIILKFKYCAIIFTSIQSQNKWVLHKTFFVEGLRQQLWRQGTKMQNHNPTRQGKDLSLLWLNVSNTLGKMCSYFESVFIGTAHFKK